MKFKQIKLYTSKLEEQKKFYTQVLGMTLLEEKENSFILSIGKTKLEFVYKLEATPYHFALNIPSNQGAEALAWLKERVAVLDFEGQELVDFKDWNAEAMYFYDADNNIVEFIARKNLKEIRQDAFSVNSILEVCEIGVPTDNVASFYNSIQEFFAIEVYSGDLTRFAALGDERGLFIVINDEVKKWIPRDDEPFRSPFEVELEFRKALFKISFEDGFCSFMNK